MTIKDRTRIIFAMLMAGVFLGGCRSATGMPKGPNAEWHLVIIGDSSMWRLSKAFSAQIERDVGVEVLFEDFAFRQLSAGEVLQVLQTGKTERFRLDKLPGALVEADVVVMFVNPINSIDLEDPLNLDGCFLSQAPEACEPESFEKWTSDLKAIWGEIFKLRDGRPTILRATDIYNPLVIPWKENSVFETCTRCWENMSVGARLAAEAYDIPFLSRLDAFNGLSREEDPRAKGYIVSDGEHPSDLAAQITARLLAEMGYDPVPPP